MKSYLKFLSRNKLYTTIEAVGLVVGLGFVILIGSYIFQQFALTYENPDRSRIYVPGTPGVTGLTYGFPEVITQIPEIEKVARLCVVETSIGRDEKESVTCAAIDRSFFEILSNYSFIEGDGDAISSRSNVIVSESFASTNGLSLGDEVIIDKEEYTVGAVFKDQQGSVMQDYSLFMAAEIFEDDYEPFDNFGSTLCFIKARVGTNRQVLYDKLETPCKEVYPDIYGHSFFDHLVLYRYDELYFKNTSRLFKHGDIKTVHTLLLVGLLLLLSSIFNYINLSVALYGKRAKEMAVRKLHGASRYRISIKYISESILFTSFCFVGGLLFALTISPTLNELLNDPDVPIKIVWSPGYLIAYAVIIVLVGIICGSFPAIISSRYNALDVMKGRFRQRTKMVFSKVFIVLQNAITVILIALAITMEAQMKKTQNRPFHCNIKDKVFLSIFAEGNTTPFYEALRSLPCVKRVGTCNGAPGFRPGGQYSTTRSGNDIMYRLYRMDSTAFQMFDFEILEDFNAPIFNSVWFSDASYVATGFDSDYHDISLLSQRTKGCNQLAGIFKAFPTNFSNIGEEDHAIISIGEMNEEADCFIIEITGDKKVAYAKIIETYETFAKQGNISFDEAFYIDKRIEEAWRPSKNNMRLVEIFMLLSIVLSSLGLVAMSTYYADEKSHDIAVRKVFGSSIETEVWHTIRGYMELVTLSCVIGIPISVYAAQEYLTAFIYKLEGYWWIIITAVLFTCFIAFVSVFWQTLKVVKTNPVLELKKE